MTITNYLQFVMLHAKLVVNSSSRMAGLHQPSNAASTNSTQTLSLEDVLHVLLLCFEAAADAFPQPTVAYAMPCRHRPGEKPIWQIWMIEDLATKPPRQTDNFLPPRPREALSRKNMCDYFCWMMEQKEDKTLRNMFGSTAKYMQF